MKRIESRTGTTLLFVMAVSTSAGAPAAVAGEATGSFSQRDAKALSATSSPMERWERIQASMALRGHALSLSPTRRAAAAAYLDRRSAGNIPTDWAQKLAANIWSAVD